MRSPRVSRPKSPAVAHTDTSACASQDDLREYLVHLDGMNLSEAQKIELLQTLWPIMSAFVDLAFDTDRVQQALPSAVACDTDAPDSAGHQEQERDG